MPRASPVPAQRLVRSVRVDEAGARLEKGKAFLAYQGGYMVTTDPAKIAENASLRMGRISTESRRVLSGSINALGEQVADYGPVPGRDRPHEPHLRPHGQATPKPVRATTPRGAAAPAGTDHKPIARESVMARPSARRKWSTSQADDGPVAAGGLLDDVTPFGNEPGERREVLDPADGFGEVAVDGFAQ
jgi:hypothetical protein